MASPKKKKNHAKAPLAALEATHPSSSECLSSTPVPIDYEPKVSFTLEFYSTDGRESAFIGRIKKIGSEEQATLINDLDNQTLLDFIVRNLPKAWQKSAVETPTFTEKQSTSIQAQPDLGIQKTVDQVPSVPLLQPDIQDMQVATLEIWQNGKKSNIVDCSQVISLHLDAPPFQQWTKFQANFKSLEAGIASHTVNWNKFTDSLDIPLAQRQVKPGLYHLTCTVMGNEKPLVFTANQLLQLV